VAHQVYTSCSLSMTRGAHVFCRYLLRLAGGLLLLVGCASTGRTLVSVPAQGPILAPTWRPGDEWGLSWESPKGRAHLLVGCSLQAVMDGVLRREVRETGELITGRPISPDHGQSQRHDRGTGNASRPTLRVAP